MSDSLLVLIFGALLGAIGGWWRCWAFARKLRHFGISLDAWSDYCEANRQAKGEAAPIEEVETL